MSETRPKYRRWFQFRLRTLLIAVLVLSLPLSWFAVRMEKARRQREAVEAIEKLGGRVLYDREATHASWVLETGYHWHFLMSGRPKPASPGWRSLLGNDFFDDVVFVKFLETKGGDAILEPLKDLPDLERLLVRDSRITHAGLEKLGALPGLQELVLYGPSTDDGVLEHLRATP